MFLWIYYILIGLLLTRVIYLYNIYYIIKSNTYNRFLCRLFELFIDYIMKRKIDNSWQEFIISLWLQSHKNTVKRINQRKT
jgi:hypothetical protein